MLCLGHFKPLLAGPVHAGADIQLALRVIRIICSIRLLAKHQVVGLVALRALLQPVRDTCLLLSWVAVLAAAHILIALVARSV
jgi:hypothetical protein